MSERQSASKTPLIASNTLYRLVLAAVVTIACLRVVTTYKVFSETWDEALHVATGVEWLDRGRYTYEYQQPPIAQIAAGLGPYLDGARTHDRPNYLAEGHAIVYAPGDHAMRTLALARLGLLPFLVLGALVVARWTRELAGDAAGVIAAVLFTTNPSVLAHAGLANTDVASASAMAAALFSFGHWIERRTMRTTLWLGFTLGLALLTKFSAVPFLGLAIVLALAAVWLLRERFERPASSVATVRLVPSVGFVLAIVLMMTLLIYRFSFGHVEVPRTSRVITLPVPQLIIGLREVFRHNNNGHFTYFLGMNGERGWWYYFPVALFVKTPIPSMLLAAAGIMAAVRQRTSIQPLVPIIGVAAILLLAMPAHINIGLRHVLGVYPLLAVLGGYGAAALLRELPSRIALWSAPRWLAPLLVGALLTAQAAESAWWHPDYLPYFNMFAGKHPERILVAGDLDWGQDLLRLRDALRARRIDSVSVGYFGSADVRQYGMPGARELVPHVPTDGWIAISEGCVVGMVPCASHGYDWLVQHYTPVAHIGKTFRLYYVPPRATTVSQPAKPYSVEKLEQFGPARLQL